MAIRLASDSSYKGTNADHISEDLYFKSDFELHCLCREKEVSFVLSNFRFVYWRLCLITTLTIIPEFGNSKLWNSGRIFSEIRKIWKTVVYVTIAQRRRSSSFDLQSIYLNVGYNGRILSNKRLFVLTIGWIDANSRKV